MLASSWHDPCDRGCMPQIQSFRDLEVWAVAMDLVDDIFKAGRAMPRDEFEVRRQMTRAAISIPSNIAEGWNRKRRRGADQNHVSIAMGSVAELETLCEVCFRNSLLVRDNWSPTSLLLMRVRLMLNRLHDALD